MARPRVARSDPNALPQHCTSLCIARSPLVIFVLGLLPQVPDRSLFCLCETAVNPPGFCVLFVILAIIGYCPTYYVYLSLKYVRVIGFSTVSSLCECV